MLFGIACPKCGVKNAKEARFCAACGNLLNAEQCAACGVALPPNSRFCPACGATVRGAVPVGKKIKDNRWVRPPDVFAARAEDVDLRRLEGKLTIEPGVRALIFQGPKYRGVLPPGAYTTQSLMDRLPIIGSDEPSSAVLVEDGDVELALEFKEPKALQTQDRQKAEISLSLLVAVKDPEAFFAQLFRGRTVMTKSDLRDWLAEEIRSLVAGCVGSRPFKAFAPDTSLRKEIEDELRVEMSQSLARWGLDLVRLRFVEVILPEIDKAIYEPGARLARDEEQLKLREQLAKISDRVRELQNQDFISKFQRHEDLEDYVKRVEHETGLRNLMRSDEMQAAKQDFDKNELTRRIALERLKVELAYEQAAAKLRLQGELNEEGLRQRMNLERQKLEHDLSQRKLQFMTRQEEIVKARQTELDLQLQEARTDAEKARVEREQDAADLELAHLALERTKEIKRRDDRERMLMELEAEQKRLEMAIEGKRVEAELEERSLKARSAASIEALLSSTGGAEGQNLKDFVISREEIEARKAMSPEQLLALVADRSPDAAKALAEEFKAKATPQAAQMALLRELVDRQDAQYKESADRLERVASKAMDQLGAAAHAGAGRPDVPGVVLAGPGGFPVSGGGGGVKKVLVCTKCEMENAVGSKFCQSCGAQL